MALVAGTKLGPYEIQSPLGAGGMGEVYRALDTRLDRTVAIKILAPHLSTDPTLRQRFEREAKAISSLNHAHICMLHDVGCYDGINYLVMEFIDGETLTKRLGKGPFALEQVLKFGEQIAEALDTAHRSNHPPRSKTRQHHAYIRRRKTPRLWPGKTVSAAGRPGDTVGRGHATIASYRERHNRRNVSIYVAGANRRERAGFSH